MRAGTRGAFIPRGLERRMALAPKLNSEAARHSKDARKPHRDERALFKFEMRERRDELWPRGRIEQTAHRKILRVAGLRSVKRRGIHKRQFHVSGAWLEAQWQPKKR
jgi:hypothetical protein